MDYKKKFFLFKQGDHFCSVPWNHVEIFSNGDVRTCSKGQVFGNLLDQDLSDILKNQWVSDLRNNLVNDRAHENCTQCYNLSTGKDHTDLRHYYNSIFKKADIDYTNTNAFKLHGIDLHWDNTCNLKCVYCNPMQSSLIAQEQNVVFSKPKESRLDEVVDLILENQWNLQEIYLSGGEPMLIKHNYNLLSRLENFDLPLRINSNITFAQPGNRFFEQIKKFKNVLWTISAESSGARYEYTRFGSKWNTFVENLDHIQGLGHKIRINSVWFVGSAVSIFSNLRFFIEQYRITDITINQLSNHPAMLVRNAPDSVKQTARSELQSLLDSGLIIPNSNGYYNIARCNRELDAPIEDPQGYKTYFDQLDQLRGTDWRKIYTELDQ